MTERRSSLRHWAAAASILPLGLPWAAYAADSVAAQPPAAGFQDHYIADGKLAPDIISGTEAAADLGGLARALRIDAVASLLQSHDGFGKSSFAEHGLILNYQWDTANYGAWTLDATARTGGSGPGEAGAGQGGLFALRQRAMPFDHGWQIDNSVGNINTTEVSLARNQARFYLPTTPIRGVSSEWRGPDGIQLSASLGEPGNFSGIEVPNFRALGGHTDSAGGQWSLDPHWTLAGEYVDARDVNLSAGFFAVSPQAVSSSTGMAALRWHDQGAQSQLTLLDGHMQGQSQSNAAWWDASLSQGARTQNFGLFRVEPNLSWGEQLIANDLQGGYYRYGFQTRRWIADLGADLVRSVSGRSGNTRFLTGDTRFQLSQDWGLGGVTHLSTTNGGTSWSTQGYVDHRNVWGTGSAQTGYAHGGDGYDLSMTYSQSWDMPIGTHLSTAVSAEKHGMNSGAVGAIDSTVLSFALAGGGQISRRWSFDGNLRWLTTVQGRGAPAVSSNMAITYTVNNRWNLLFSYYDARIGSWLDLTVLSPLTPPAESYVPSTEQRGLFLTLRYQRASGLHFAPLGGKPGMGSGQVSGYVYLDANENGRMDPDEKGADHVTVVLDGKYSIQTDANGRYEFGAVSIGHHTLTIVTDNLPLPWALTQPGSMDVEVRTRSRSSQDFAATRIR